MKQHLNTLIIAVAVIISGYLLAKGYQSRATNQNAISVTGLGEENFTSDLIVWSGSFSSKDYELKTANYALNQQQKTILNYLKSKGLNESEIVFEGVNIQRDYSYNYDDRGVLINTTFNGFNLTQNMKVTSKKVDVVEELSRRVTDLIDLGVEFNSFPPEFYYTKLAQLKLRMIESATKDAQERAAKIAQNAGGELGHLKNADMGVFQITGENSSEDYSWGGSFNTSSKKKTANITIRLKYEIN